MIKFRIHPKFGRGEVQIWEMSKLQDFDIFWDILDKMKDNLGQECVRGGGGFNPSRTKLKQLPLIAWEK